MLAEYCPTYLLIFFSKETRLAVSMNETASASMGTKCWVVFVLKDFLAVYLRQAIRSSKNWEDNVWNISLLLTIGASEDVKQR